MNKRSIIFLIANIPLSLLLFYIFAVVCSLFQDPFTLMRMVGFLYSLFSLIIIAIDLLILRGVKRSDFLTVFLCVVEVSSIAFLIYLWQRSQTF